MTPPAFDSSASIERPASSPNKLPVLAGWAQRATVAVRARLLAFDRQQLPFSHFEDCGVGNKRQREAAFAENKERKDFILPYIRAWCLRGLAMCVALLTAGNAQVLGGDTALLQAFLGICVAACITACLVMSVAWMGLTCMHD